MLGKRYRKTLRNISVFVLLTDTRLRKRSVVGEVTVSYPFTAIHHRLRTVSIDLDTYEILMTLSTGQIKSFQSRNPSSKHASSIMSHLSDYKTPIIVTRVPSTENKDNILKEFPMVSLITVTCDVGMRLDTEDRLTYGYGYINISGNNIEEIDTNFQLVKERLDFQFHFVNTSIS